MPQSARQSSLMIQDDRLEMAGIAVRWVLAAMLAGAPIGTLFLLRAGAQHALLWAVVFAAAGALALILCWLLRHWERRLPGPRRELFNGALMALAGGGWGALALLLPDPVPVPVQAALVFLQLPAAMLGCVLLCATRVGFLCFVLGVLGPLAWRDPVEALPLGPWGVALAGILLMAAHDLLHRSLGRLLRQRRRSESLVREQQMILDTATEGILLVRDGRIVKCNRRSEEILGVPPGSITGSRLSHWHDDRQEAALREVEFGSVARGSRFSYVTQLRASDGRCFWAELSARARDPVADDNGVVWVMSDISARRDIEMALRVSERRFRRLVSLSSDWYWEQDTEMRFTQLSGVRVNAVLGQSGDVLGKRRWEIPSITGVSDEQWTLHRAALAAREPFEGFIYQARLVDGSTRWVSISGHPMYDDEGRFCGYHGVGKDVTERVEHAEQIRHQAHHDPLTGLPNRRLMIDRLEHAMAQARRSGRQVGLMLLDLDDFKLINDNEGHAIGDSVLVVVAQRLRQVVRESDTVARLGGDEFVLLLPDIEDQQDAVAVAEKIGVAIREPVDAGQHQYTLGASIGIAVFPADAQAADRLLALADAAMYRCKRAGGGHAFAQAIGQTSLALEHAEAPVDANARDATRGSKERFS